MNERVAALAALLLAARRHRRPIDELPEELVPRSTAEAYDAQEAAAASLGDIVGWKVGAASPTAEPSCAPLFDPYVLTSPTRWETSREGEGLSYGIECELAFRFAAALPPRAMPYGEDEVLAAVGTLHPAIELVQSRFLHPETVSKLALLADNLANLGLCVDVPVLDWRHVDFWRQPASLVIDDREKVHAVGGNMAGDPRRLLVWLANHCAGRGRGIAAGDIVTTGTHTGLVSVTVPAQITARFAGIGEARMQLLFSRHP